MKASRRRQQSPDAVTSSDSYYCHGAHTDADTYAYPEPNTDSGTDGNTDSAAYINAGTDPNSAPGTYSDSETHQKAVVGIHRRYGHAGQQLEASQRV